MENTETVERFNEFLKSKEINSMGKERTIFNINEIRQFDKALGQSILENPLACVPYFEESVSEINSKHVGFEGAFGLNFHTPRTIRSTFISKMVCIEGIVTSISQVRPKIKRSVHYCKSINTFYEKNYRDSTMISNLPSTNTIYPTRNGDNLPLMPEYGLSEYTDFQTISLQEMPENSPPGVLPRDILCILTDDLVDKVKPGDRVRVYGIFKSFSGGGSEFPSTFRTMVIVNNVWHLNETSKNYEIDIGRIKLVACSDMKFRAIAPTIFGHDDIKKALALMMVGGNEKLMKNGSRIRGDINILLIGDPSTAKSQLLRYVVNTMPLTVATTGRGSSGVGLTAAVVVDKDTGEKRLEAGAMVIGDRGVVCIDEFDKMNEIDRVAIHEVMEQQTVTISKAGIHTTLNARCSVLAAANPAYGNYNDRIGVQENVNLPESLMTRFDLVFITRDSASVEDDSQISKHVLRMRSGEDDGENVISQELFKSYIGYAKNLRPVLTRDAADMIVKEYTEMRQRKNNKELVVNVTPRFLETMIRLSTANAKLRLSEIVECQDVEEMKRLMNGNIVKKKRNTSKRIKIEEKSISLGEEIRSSARDEVLSGLWKWNEEHRNEPFILTKDLSTSLGIEFGTVEDIINELSAQDLIMYDNGRIYFLD